MKTGLILVDIQNDYFPGGRMELVGINEASAKARHLLSLFRQNQWPTFHRQHVACRESSTVTGCIRQGVKVWHVMEVILFELLDTTGVRTANSETGFQLLEP